MVHDEPGVHGDGRRVGLVWWTSWTSACDPTMVAILRSELGHVKERAERGDPGAPHDEPKGSAATRLVYLST